MEYVDTKKGNKKIIVHLFNNWFNISFHINVDNYNMGMDREPGWNFS